jgi:hypothetical protein
MWELHDTGARLESAELSGSLDVAQISAGFSKVLFRQQNLAGLQILQVMLPENDGVEPPGLVDVYSRGTDLIATYRLPGSTASEVQIYWRFVREPDLGLAGLELIVSVRTDVLYSDPRLQVGNQLPSDSAVRLADATQGRFDDLEIPEAAHGETRARDSAQAVLYALNDGRTGLLEIAHGADIAQTRIDRIDAHRFRSSYDLFEDHIEKGVIRRARMRSMVLPHDNVRGAAVECFRRFADAAVPLAT